MSSSSPEESWVDFDFNGDFDAIPGPGYTLDDYEGLILLLALDSKFWSGFKFASHWILSCYCGESVAINTTISFWIMITNGQTSGTVNAYVIDNENILL